MKYMIPAIVVLITVVYLIFKISTHIGYKEGYGNYFVTPALFGPALIIMFSKRKHYGDSLFYSLCYIGLLLVATELFWDYMDKPWFSPPETNTCDGPCYGWFSFENDSALILAGITIYGIFSVLLGSIIYGLVEFNRKKQS